MKMKALIVDDEYPARQELRYLLEEFEALEVVGEAASATEAFKLIQALEYDVLFLDINLPGCNGLELASRIQTLDRKPRVVFTTAYDHYAIEAFGVNALDYLLKPVSKSRLRQAVKKIPLPQQGRPTEEALAQDMKESPADEMVSPLEPLESEELLTGRIVAESKGRMVLVDIDDIYYLYSEGDLVYLKTYSEKMIIRFTLKEVEGRLMKNHFFRTHRSYIVNIHKVKEIAPFFNGTYLLITNDEEKSEVPVSRNQARKLKKILPGC